MANRVKLLVQGYARELDGGWLATCNTTLVQTEKHNIVVDPGINRNLLLEGLQKESLATDDIDYVFITHHHPDHSFLAALFDKAKVFDGEIIYEDDKETPYEDVLPGTDIRVMATPGHDDEHASLVVPTEDKGKVVVAGDVFWWMDDEEQKTDLQSLLNKEDSFTKDVKALRKSREEVVEIADWIIPGHGKEFKSLFEA